jgi:hypothetical protein
LPASKLKRPPYASGLSLAIFIKKVAEAMSRVVTYGIISHSIFLGLYLQVWSLLSRNILNHVILILIVDIVVIIAKPVISLDGGVADEAPHRSRLSDF